jgi:hypothetical protein
MRLRSRLGKIDSASGAEFARVKLALMVVSVLVTAGFVVLLQVAA